MKLKLNVCLVALVALFLLSGTAYGQRGLQRAAEVLNGRNPQFFGNDEVVATGISTDANGDAIIKVYLKTNRGPAIPQFAEGISVVSQVVGVIRAGNPVIPFPAPPGKGGGGGGGGGGGTDPKDRQARPVPIGVSIGTYRPNHTNYCFAGTLGCRLTRIDLQTSAETHYILSNNHVMAEENAGSLNSDQILQPGTLDNGCTLDLNDIVGELSDFEPILFNGSDNYVDAAIALTDSGDVGFASPADAYGAPTSNTVAAAVGMPVQKFGRTTSLTKGQVDAINVTVNVSYSSGTARFVNQVMIVGTGRGKNRSFSDSGDSGSLIVTDPDADPFGLLFAGNSSVTVANPIDAVLDTFSDPGNGIVFVVDDGN